jgi:hypothetical protein
MDMKKIGAALAVLVVCAGPAVAAKPPKTTPTLTIAASSTNVVFGRTFTVSGTTTNVAAGTKVGLQQSPYPYSGFKPSGKTAVVDPSGNWSIAGVAPQANTQYRARVSKTNSTAVTVHVRLRVAFNVGDSTPKKGQRVRFSGTVAPDRDGKPVLIQKKTASGFKTVARTTLLDNGTANSKYSRRVKINSKGTYRVVVQSGGQDLDNGVSRSRTLKVH